MKKTVLKPHVSKREEYLALYERAKKLTKPDPEGAVYEAELLLHLKKIIEIDEDVMREREAKRIMDYLAGPPPEQQEQQLIFEGFGVWDWDPRRLVRSNDGMVIENYQATLKFKIADAERSNKHADESLASSRRKQHEANVFMRWTYKRMNEGAKPETLTWGACVEDLGVLETAA